MSKIKYILFDAANTLIHKPDLWTNFVSVLENYGYSVAVQELKLKHKLLSEIIDFPDVTSETFYNKFNASLLNSLGVIHDKAILKAVFEACKYLPWKAFDDLNELSHIKNIPFGVLSNFNSNLRNILLETCPNVNFGDVIISEEEQIAKPQTAFYKLALEKIGLKADEILYIGDSLKLDIIPALEVGFNVCLIDREAYYKHSKYRIDSFKDLTLKLD